MVRKNSWPLKVSLLVLLLCAPANAFAQASPAVALRVSGEMPDHLELSVADIAAFPRDKIRVTDDKGAQVEYGGVPVAEILKKAGAPLGKELKGPNLAVGLVARAPDGYRVLFTLTEFDPAFSDRVILLADRRDGKPLDSREGPLRFIVPGDKRHARWIRGVTAIEAMRVK
ncbi:MAG: molybdopterin-dependent oxidoreductase [Candidatus Binatus sp.]|uniref:molybdopterin-dependent oxidoreductase n=1 Tax=Candidatus Binatus sp. TaxID=2811406 RepID=UPI003BAEB3E2